MTNREKHSKFLLKNLLNLVFQEHKISRYSTLSGTKNCAIVKLFSELQKVVKTNVFIY